MITPASLTAYCMSIIYGYALISDSENIRTVKSSHADEFLDNPARRDLLIELERCHVPNFLKNILTGLTSTFDPRRPDILYVNTLAAFSLHHDYGKSFPISMFIKAHHLVATRPSNTDPNAIFQQWASLPITTGTVSLEIAQLIGSHLSNGTYDNWLLQRIRTLFNPVTSRNNTSRPTFAPLPTFPLETDSWTVNPYIYLLNASDNNIFETLKFTRSFSAIVNEQMKGSTQLGSMFDSPSGVQIMTHFYHGAALPTWHYYKVQDTTDEIPAPTFASAIGFLTTPKAGSDTNSLPFPTDDTTIDPELYLVKKGKNKKSNDERTAILFSSKYHVLPDVRYFDPYAYTPTTLPFTMMTGLSIESEEIDGFTVPQPDLTSSLYDENAHTLQSAVPLILVMKATQLGSAKTTALSRASRSTTNPQVSMNLYDSSVNMLPTFNTTVEEQRPTTGLYAFKATGPLTKFSRAFNRIAYKLSSQELVESIHAPPNSLYLWSSYRYININVARNTPLVSRIFMIANFRTIYGTNVTMSQSVHPARLIPLA